MIKISCDICNKNIDINKSDNKVAIEIDGVAVVYDLCDECKHKLQQLLKTAQLISANKIPDYKITKFNQSVDASLIHATHVILSDELDNSSKKASSESLKKQIEERLSLDNSDDDRTAEEIQKDREERAKRHDKLLGHADNTIEDQIEVQVQKALKLHEQYEKNRKRHRKGETEIGKVEKYGIEKFARQYLSGVTSYELAAQIGVNRFVVAEFIKKYKLQKRHRAAKTEPSKEDN